MKKPITTIIFVLFSILFGGCSAGRDHTQERQAGQSDVIALACDPIPVVRVGFIGLGMRGIGAVERFMYLDSVEVVALCDLEAENLARSQAVLREKTRPEAAEYMGPEGWKRLCERPDIDLVYISTDWLSHTPMAVYAMEQGKHVAVEVPAAVTVEECWKLVDTAEKTRRHCMMLENCCYDFFELATLNMAQQGLFGEIVHAEGAYIHDLRELSFNGRWEDGSYVPGVGKAGRGKGPSGYWNYGRREYSREHTGNPYPTHGLGPVCQALNIHRGDRMTWLVSLSSDQFGMKRYAAERFGKEAPEATDYRLGDMNTTLIRTAKGKSILIQHDVTSPRPYSRIHLLSGTKGFARKYPVKQIALEPDAHSALDEARMDSLLARYEHPFSREIGELARRVGGHGGMDFIMDYRLVYCLHRGLPLDMDVYDAAEWSCIVGLSEQSVLAGSRPVEIPDFTRGAWKKLSRLEFAGMR